MTFTRKSYIFKIRIIFSSYIMLSVLRYSEIFFQDPVSRVINCLGDGSRVGKRCITENYSVTVSLDLVVIMNSNCNSSVMVSRVNLLGWWKIEGMHCHGWLNEFIDSVTVWVINSLRSSINTSQLWVGRGSNYYSVTKCLYIMGFDREYL